MIKQTSFALSIFLSFSLSAQFTLQFNIHSLPSYHSDNDDIYIAGTFNNWNPKDENYKFQKTGIGIYSVTLKVKEKTGEYKLTRGSWDKVECTNEGGSVPNRQYNTEANDLLGIIVQGWADHFLPKPKTSTASRHVKIMDTAFHIPQLKRKRTIRVYLPDDYSNSKKRYPVLYARWAESI